MEILSLRLLTHQLDQQYAFFKNTLGLTVSKGENAFSARVGNTELIFASSEEAYQYHYCFLIPRNKLNEAKLWFSERMDLVPVKPKEYIVRFDAWNAESFYFWDGGGNLAECIVRHDYPNDASSVFDQNSLLNVNEIGVCTSGTLGSLDTFLKNELGTSFYKGNLERFGTHGDEQGIFLLINNLLKENWFPTDLGTQASPFEITLRQSSRLYSLQYDGTSFRFI